MKILLINNFHYLRGGSERAYFDMGRLFEENGHEVAYFSTKNEKNQLSKYSDYFASDFDLRGDYNFFKKIYIALRTIYNKEAKQNINKLLDDFKPDRVIMHNIYHHLTPIIIREIKKRNIETVQVLHDYKIICPNYKLFNNNKICEECKNRKYYKCFKNKCGGSWLRSFLLMLELYINAKKYNQVDKFIAPSEFVRDKFIEFGIDDKKISVINHFIDLEKFKPDKNKQVENYFLYFGRLSEEKGVDILIKAVNNMPTQKLKIVGDGEWRNYLKKISGDNENIEFLGYKSGSELIDIIQKAKAVIFPSVWYEVFGYSMLEAMAMGKVVFAGNIGAIPEIIKDKINGYLFAAGNVEDLTDKISNINFDKKIQMNAVKTALNYEKNRYYKALINFIK